MQISLGTTTVRRSDLLLPHSVLAGMLFNAVLRASCLLLFVCIVCKREDLHSRWADTWPRVASRGTVHGTGNVSDSVRHCNNT